MYHQGIQSIHLGVAHVFSRVVCLVLLCSLSRSRDSFELQVDPGQLHGDGVGGFWEARLECPRTKSCRVQSAPRAAKKSGPPGGEGRSGWGEEGLGLLAGRFLAGREPRSGGWGWVGLRGRDRTGQDHSSALLWAFDSKPDQVSEQSSE